MSWRGFTKAVDRASTSLMQKTGAIEKTVDKDYEDEEKRFKNLESKIMKLQKESKGYLDAIRAMTIAQQRMADTINQFYDEGAQLASLGLKYKEVATKLDEEIRTELDKEYRESVLDPLGEYADFFPQFNETIKRRQKKLLDYDSARSKVRKLAEKPAEDVDKLPKAERHLVEIKELYESVNKDLVEDIPKLIDARVAWLDPSFEALIKCQLKFTSDAYVKLQDLKLYFQQHGSNGQNIEGRVESVLQQLRDLTIVGNPATQP